MAVAPQFENLGMVVARVENLWRLDVFGLRRAEFVIFDPATRGSLLEYIRGTDLRFSVHTPMFMPEDYPENPLLACIVDPDDDRRCRAVGLMMRNMDLAAELGGEYTVVHVQRPEQFAGAAPGAFREREAMRMALLSAEVLAAHSDRTGVPVLLENLMDNATFYSAVHYLEVLDAFPQLGFCLDVGHLDMDARRFGINIMEFVQALAPRTRAVHLQNSFGPTHPTAPRPWKIPVHPSQNPCDGWVDIRSVLSAVLRANPACVINFEFRPEKSQGNEFILEGMNWIRQILIELDGE
jgi:sugar phosphate isomerase/epimerase